MREPLVRSNKSPLPEVKLLHKKKHWLTKAKDNYERNYISENIGRGLRLGPRHSGGSNFNNGHDKCCDGDDDHQVRHHDQQRNNQHLHAGDGLHHVPDEHGRGAGALLFTARTQRFSTPEGHVVTWSAVRPDLPATVYYVREGDRMLVRKIVLSKPAVIEQKETTTTTTTEKP